MKAKERRRDTDSDDSDEEDGRGSRARMLNLNVANEFGLVPWRGRTLQDVERGAILTSSVPPLMSDWLGSGFVVVQSGDSSCTTKPYNPGQFNFEVQRVNK